MTEGPESRSPPEPPAEERTGRPERDWDAYTAAIASFIGMLALAVSGYNAYLQRQQVRAMSWPNLQLSVAPRTFRYLATNNGLGPARVTAVKIEVDGKPLKSWVEVVRATGNRAETGFVFSSFNGRVVTPREEVEVFKAAEGDEGRNVFDGVFRNPRHRVAMTVCYCSVLDECWLTTRGLSAAARAQDGPIDRCPIDENQQFRN